VREGDNLQSIAQKVWGDASRAPGAREAAAETALLLRCASFARMRDSSPRSTLPEARSAGNRRWKDEAAAIVGEPARRRRSHKGVSSRCL
jgi:hypothetical protein